jgi:CRP-like cAMP-binding protein
VPGTALGEIAFVTGASRTATVTADTAVVFRVLRKGHFDAVARSQPNIASAIQEELLRRIGARLAAASAMARDLLE